MTDQPDRQALLVMDFQAGVVERFGDDHRLLGRVRSAIDAAHAAGLLVVYVRVAFRPGFPEVSPANRSFSAIAAIGTKFDESAPGTQIHSMLASQSEDVIVTKRRVGAFSGSDLEVLLRSRRVGTLALSGIATSGVVLSTLSLDPPIEPLI